MAMPCLSNATHNLQNDIDKKGALYECNDQRPNCIFCKIVAGEIPSIPVFEDAHTLAFMDINPIAPGHTLIIPKRHWANIFAMPDAQLGYVAASAKRVASAGETSTLS